MSNPTNTEDHEEGWVFPRSMLIGFLRPMLIKIFEQ
jgi:hypothetical protein